MYAIVEIAGLQYKVQKDQYVYVHRLAGNEGDKVSFDRVMLAEDKNGVVVGAPVIEGAEVSATIKAHVKADKVIIFKKKRRKGYDKKTGHRQPMTQIVITNVKLSGGKKKAAAVEAEAPAAKKAAPAKKTAVPKKAAAPKKEAAPKAAAKKTTTKKAATPKAEK